MFDYSTLDPNIRETVRRLNGWGFGAWRDVGGDRLRVLVRHAPIPAEARRLRSIFARSGVKVHVVETATGLDVVGLNDGSWP